MREAIPGQQISVVIAMTIVYCAVCGSPFGMSEELQQRRRKDGEKFYCPSGHVNIYHLDKGELDKAQLVELRTRAEKAEADLLVEKRVLEATQKKLQAALEAATPTRTAVPAPPPRNVPAPKTVADQVLAWLATVPVAVHYQEIAKGIGAGKGTVNATCSTLFRRNMLDRPQPGMFMLRQAAPTAE